MSSDSTSLCYSPRSTVSPPPGSRQPTPPSPPSSGMLMLIDAAEALKDTPADGPGTGVMMSVHEQPVASSNALSQQAKNGAPRRALNTKAASSAAKPVPSSDAEKPMTLYAKVKKDAMASIKSPEKQELLGQTLKIFENLEMRGDVNVGSLVGTYTLDSMIVKYDERDAFKTFYMDILGVAKKHYPTGCVWDAVCEDNVRKCFLAILADAKKKIADRKKNADARANMTEADKVKKRKHAAEVAWAKMTPDQKATFLQMEEERAEKVAKKEKEKQEKLQHPQIVDGVRIIVHRFSNMKEFLLNEDKTMQNYSQIKEDNAKVSFVLGVLKRGEIFPVKLLADAMNGIIDGMPFSPTHTYAVQTLDYCRDKAALAANKDDTVLHHKFETVFSMLFLLSYGGRGKNDTGLNTTRNTSRVPCVDDKTLEGYMKKTEKQMEKWGWDMLEPSLITTEVSKITFDSELKKIVDDFGDLLEDNSEWEKDNVMLMANYFRQTILRAHAKIFAKNKSVKGCAGDLLEGKGVFDKQEQELASLTDMLELLKTKRSEAVASGNTSEEDIQKISDEIAHAERAVIAAAKNLQEIKGQGIRTFLVESSEAGAKDSTSGDDAV